MLIIRAKVQSLEARAEQPKVVGDLRKGRPDPVIPTYQSHMTLQNLKDHFKKKEKGHLDQRQRRAKAI